MRIRHSGKSVGQMTVHEYRLSLFDSWLVMLRSDKRRDRLIEVRDVAGTVEAFLQADKPGENRGHKAKRARASR